MVACTAHVNSWFYCLLFYVMPYPMVLFFIDLYYLKLGPRPCCFQFQYFLYLMGTWRSFHIYSIFFPCDYWKTLAFSFFCVQNSLLHCVCYKLGGIYCLFVVLFIENITYNFSQESIDFVVYVSVGLEKCLTEVLLDIDEDALYWLCSC